MKRVNKYTTHAWILTATLGVTACGGGGGGSESAAAPEPAAATEQPTSSADDAVTRQGDVDTAELKVPADFSLSQDTSLSITINAGIRRHVSVCSDFNVTAGGYEIDYQSCLLRTATTQSVTQLLTLPKTVSSLIAVSWYYNAGAAPTFAIWDRESDGQTFVVN